MGSLMPNSMRFPVAAILILLSGAAVAAGPAPAAAGPVPPVSGHGPSWTETKCVRYRAAFAEAVRRVGTAGLGADFLSRHDAFLASGCEVREVCPRSPQEIRLADILTVAAMNFGTASTFPPFRCPADRR